MGKPCSIALERKVKRLLKLDLTERVIAKRTHLARGTVARIRTGQRVSRPELLKRYRAAKRYRCKPCSEAANGETIFSCLRPCVACDARNARRALNRRKPT